MGRYKEKKPKPRDKEILKLFRNGYNMAQLGRRYALTRQRIFQILERWHEKRSG